MISCATRGMADFEAGARASAFELWMVWLVLVSSACTNPRMSVGPTQ